MKQITVLFSGRKQAVYLLDEAHVVIGRGRSAHIALDGNPIVSRQHAVIREELGEHIIEDLGGDVTCVPISAKENVNINVLEDKIVRLAEKKLNLMEDHSMPAQCIVIESNVDEKSGQTTASVLVKKGCLRLGDTFVCGTDDGKRSHASASGAKDANRSSRSTFKMHLSSLSKKKKLRHRNEVCSFK